MLTFVLKRRFAVQTLSQKFRHTELSPEVKQTIIACQKKSSEYAQVPKDRNFSFQHNETTFMLLKKYVILKALSSNFFINRSLGIMNLFYKFFGINLTNGLI